MIDAAAIASRGHAGRVTAVGLLGYATYTPSTTPSAVAEPSRGGGAWRSPFFPPLPVEVEPGLVEAEIEAENEELVRFLK